MSAKWTPGPWHWVNSRTDKPFDFDVEWDGEGMPSLRTVAEHETKHVGPLPDWILDAEPFQFGNDAANAYLIASAPDLADACQAAHDYLSAIPETAASGDDEAIVLCRKLAAALSRARGES